MNGTCNFLEKFMYPTSGADGRPIHNQRILKQHSGLKEDVFEEQKVSLLQVSLRKVLLRKLNLSEPALRRERTDSKERLDDERNVIPRSH